MVATGLGTDLNAKISSNLGGATGGVSNEQFAAVGLALTNWLVYTDSTNIASVVSALVTSDSTAALDIAKVVLTDVALRAAAAGHPLSYSSPVVLAINGAVETALGGTTLGSAYLAFVGTAPTVGKAATIGTGTGKVTAGTTEGSVGTGFEGNLFTTKVAATGTTAGSKSAYYTNSFNIGNDTIGDTQVGATSGGTTVITVNTTTGAISDTETPISNF